MRIVFGIVPTTLDPRTRLASAVAMHAIGTAGGFSCEAYLMRSMGQLVRAYEAGTVDLIWASPTLAACAPELRSAVPLLSLERDGERSFHGVLFVREDSDIRSLDDLRGRSVSWVSRGSGSGYVFPRVALAEAGYDPAVLFAEERFAETHGGVVEAVSGGQVDCGAGYAHFEGGDARQLLLRASFTESPDMERMRILIATTPIPSDTFLVRPGIDIDVLAEALIKGSEIKHQAFQQLFGASELRPADRFAFDEIRARVADARRAGVI